MTKHAFIERRQWVRAKRILSIQFRLKGKSGQSPWYLSLTHDMSVGGVTFYSERPFKLNDILEVQIVMSGILDIYRGEGQVIRAQKKRTGACYFIVLKLLGVTSSRRSAKTYLTDAPRVYRLRSARRFV